MTHLALKRVSTAGIFLLGGLAGLVLFARAEARFAEPFAAPPDRETSEILASATPEAAQAASPRFVYASGFQGARYYANTGATPAATGARSAPAPRTSAGPGDVRRARRPRLVDRPQGSAPQAVAPAALRAVPGKLARIAPGSPRPRRRVRRLI